MQSLNSRITKIEQSLGCGNVLQTLIDSLPDYLYVKDLNSRFLVANTACIRQLGAATLDDVVGKTDADFVAPELAARYREHEEEVMRSARTITTKEPTEHVKDGRRRWSMTTKMPLKDGQGNVVGLIGIGRDITTLKEAEESLLKAQHELEVKVQERTAELSRKNAELAEANDHLANTHKLVEAMLDNIPDRVYFKDAQSRFIKLSKALAKRFGLDDPNAAVGKTDFDFIPEEKAREFYRDEQQIIETGEPLVNKIEKQILPNGDIAWTSTTKVPLRDPEKGVIGIVGINRDITSLKMAEQKLEAVHKELMETSRRAGMAEVATGVLHNVGNVLNSVNVAVGVMGDRLQRSKASGVTRVANLLLEQNGNLGAFLTEDERGRQVPGFLKQLGDHLEQEREQIRLELAGLTRNIEHIKEIVATQQNYAKKIGVTETVELPELLEDALNIHCGAFDRHGIQLAREYEIVPKISIDKHKLLQILVNLLSNAKYACDAAGKTEKRVAVRIKASGPDRVKIEVADNGVGIAAENLTRIFSQGFTTRKAGHGFGLHSSAIAAKELGGSLIAASDGPGLGALFTVEVPLVPATQASPSVPAHAG